MIRVWGYSSRRRATESKPNVPQPKTTTVSRGPGGKFRIACSETQNGSANTACSSLTPSGMGKHIDWWAGTKGAKPPVATLEVPE